MPTRERIPLHFGEGLDRESGLMAVDPSTMFDLRNCYLHEGKVIVRAGFTDAGAGSFPEVDLLLGGEALRTERLGIVAGWKASTKQVFVYRVTPDLSIVQLLGEWDNDNGWTENIPRIIFAEVFGRVFLAHDEPAIAKRAPTVYYDSAEGDQLNFLTSTWADGTVGESVGESIGEEDRVRFRGVVRHLSYLVGWGFGTRLEPRPEFVRISLPSDPLTFDPTAYFIAGDRGVPVIGCGPVGGDPGILKVWKRQETHDLLGTDRRSFGLFLADPKYGLVAARAWVQVGGSAIAWSEEGPRLWSGRGPSQDLEVPLALDDWEPADLIDEGEEEQAFAHFVPRERVAWFHFNRRVYALTTRIPGRWRWSYHELPFTVYGSAVLFQGESEALAPAGFPDYNAPGEATNPTEPGGSFADVAWRNINQAGDETVEVWLRERQPVSGEASGTSGATDFSEFAEGEGLPAGISYYGDPADQPGGEGIELDGIEGKYFRATPGGFDPPWAYGLDSFDGFGGYAEVLARIWIPTEVGNRRVWGPATMVAGDGTGSGLSYSAGGMYYRAVNPDDYESTGIRKVSGGGATVPVSGDLQEAEQEAVWAWVRFRVDEVDAGNDRWRCKLWYGGLDDEPAGWDGDSGVGGGKSEDIVGAIGWALAANMRQDEHRIAFLSFTTDPDNEGTPTEIQETEGDWVLAGSFAVSTQAQQKERVTGLTPGVQYDVALRYRRGLLYNVGAEDTANPQTWPSVSRGTFTTGLDNPTISAAVWARNSGVEEGVTLTIEPDPDNAGADVKVYRAEASGGPRTLLATLNAPHADPLEYEDTTISGETPYWYTVTHDNGSEESPHSAESRVWAGPPEIPVHEYLNGFLEQYQLGWTTTETGQETEVHDTYDDNGASGAFQLRGTEEAGGGGAGTGEFTSPILNNVPEDGVGIFVKARHKVTAFTVDDFGEFSVQEFVQIEGDDLA